MTTLAIDIGNTRMKLGLFKGKELVQTANIKATNLEGIEAFIKGQSVEASILSSTAGEQQAVDELMTKRCTHLTLSEKLRLPMRSTYHTQNTLGMDRVAGVCGATSLFPERGCLVVDAGTCITYDLINSKSVYLGGNIAPGISMRLKAMHEFTATLPLVTKQHPETNRGYSTETAIRAGAIWGTTQEISGFIRQFDDDTEQLTVILTGGDALLLDELINWETQVEPHLVLIGLNKILTYNVE